jgi:hypothetical protein
MIISMRSIEDFFLADDLEAGGMGTLADWVLTHSHEEVERWRAGLYRVLREEDPAEPA